MANARSCALWSFAFPRFTFPVAMSIVVPNFKSPEVGVCVCAMGWFRFHIRWKCGSPKINKCHLHFLSSFPDSWLVCVCVCGFIMMANYRFYRISKLKLCAYGKIKQIASFPKSQFRRSCRLCYVSLCSSPYFRPLHSHTHVLCTHTRTHTYRPTSTHINYSAFHSKCN